MDVRSVRNLEELYREDNDKTVARFSNLFTFIQFCWNYHLTPENSMVYYKDGAMYIKRTDREVQLR